MLLCKVKQCISILVIMPGYFQTSLKIYHIRLGVFYFESPQPDVFIIATGVGPVSVVTLPASMHSK